MATFKCKMCGGDLDVQVGTSVVECDYCGTKQTVPAADDEKKLTLFNRANRLRLNNEFDKASGVYEAIVADFPEEAEAYWGLLLCNYGVEYVDDPATGKKVPTCHRSSFDSILDDQNLEMACEYADAYARRQYRDEAKQLEEIRKGIIEVSSKEEPYDIFICYKETDENGDRTLDSVLAQDVYDALTDKGYRVFFSRITLEDKLGTEYEPYIFAALNSAKVMLAVGTDYEYYNAVWVKNEWSRFLRLMAAGQKKMLIPCYKGIDAYDMPKEFAKLQAQDMGKVGAMQDLIRGIDKIFDRDKKPAAAPAAAPVVSAAPTVAPLLERAFMFLEDEKWEDANAYCEKVLDVDPKNAQAYLGKLLVELQVRKPSDLKKCAQPFDYSENYRKVLRFGDEKQREEVRGYITRINERNENDRLTSLYKRAVQTMGYANGEQDYRTAADRFGEVINFQDSKERREQCLQKAEACRKDGFYAAAKAKMVGENTVSYETAIRTFQEIPGWRDADEQIVACRKKIEEIKAKEEADRIEAERKAEADRIEAERKAEEHRIAVEAAKKKAKKIALIATPIVVACIAFVIVLTTVIIPNNKYNSAVALMDDGKYNEAITAFREMDGYKDSASQITKCQTALNDIAYSKATALMNESKYDDAIKAFEALDGYKDSASQITKCQTALKDIAYNKALTLMKEKKYNEALGAFNDLSGYKDSVTKGNECKRYLRKAALSNVKKGDVIKLGKYEQDNDVSNGTEDIKWLVLTKENKKIFVVSQYALDDCAYNSNYVNVTWEKCSLRTWLNGTFFKNAFSVDEQALIVTTRVSADKNPEFSTNSGNATNDKVFLLSIAEAEKYFPTEESRRCAPTAYAIEQGAMTFDDKTASGEETCWWWLRSPGDDQSSAAGVPCYGKVNRGGIYVSRTAEVRPAMWIDLSKL